MKVLFFGSKGWIGNMLVEEWRKRNRLDEEKNDELVFNNLHISYHNKKDLEKELDKNMPDRVVCLVGRTSGWSTLQNKYIPNIDYLEEKGKLYENIRDNLFSPLLLAILCNKRNIHLTYIGTGCIFSRDTKNNDKIYMEDDSPDFTGSSYSTVKGFTDQLMHLFDNVLNLRIRMPIVKDWRDPKSFVAKIIGFQNIYSMPNSMTYLPDLIPLMIDLSRRGETGTVNMVNKNGISHEEILELYKKCRNPDHTYNLIDENRLNTLLQAARSNNILSSSKLEELCPGKVRTIHECIEEMFKS